MFVPLASPKVLPLGKAQINLAFRSLVRTFAPRNAISWCNHITHGSRLLDRCSLGQRNGVQTLGRLCLHCVADADSHLIHSRSLLADTRTALSRLCWWQGLVLACVVGSRGLCDGRLLPVQELYSHWFPLRPTLHDIGTGSSSFFSMGDAGTTTLFTEFAGNGHHNGGYSPIHSWSQRRT